MKKTVQKMLVCLLASMMVLSTAACGGGGDNGGNGGGWGDASTGGGNNSQSSDSGSADVNEPIEGVTKPYTLNVYSFTGGYGEEWLNSLAVRYKKERAGKEFYVDGVKYDGIDFNFSKEKNTMVNMAQKGLEYDVWFQEQVYYNQIINQGNVFHDMTDVLTSDNPYEPGVTLESKLSDYQKEYYKRDTNDDGVKDTYYGIPHYAGYVGIAYIFPTVKGQNHYFG